MLRTAKLLMIREMLCAPDFSADPKKMAERKRLTARGLAEKAGLSEQIASSACTLQDCTRAMWAPSGGKHNDLQAAACVLAAARFERAAVTPHDLLNHLHPSSRCSASKLLSLTRKALRFQPRSISLPPPPSKPFIDRACSTRAPLAARRDARQLLSLLASRGLQPSPASAIICASLAACNHGVDLPLADASSGAIPLDELHLCNHSVRSALVNVCKERSDLFSQARPVPRHKLHLHIRALLTIAREHQQELPS